MSDQSEMHPQKHVCSSAPLAGTFWRETTPALNLDDATPASEKLSPSKDSWILRAKAAAADVHKSSVALEKPRSSN